MAEKLQHLTDEQKRLMGVVRDEWLTRVFDCQPLDREAATRGIEWMYGETSRAAPKIVFCASPVGAVLAAVALKSAKGRQVGDSVGASVWDSVWDSVGDSVEAPVGDSVEAPVGASVWDSVRASVWDSVGAPVGDSVEAPVRASVWDSVGDSVGDSVWWINTIGQAGFGAWTEYWQRLNIVRDDRAQRYVDWLKSGVWYSLYFENAVFLCGAPDHVGRDERGRLHSSEGPAMRWDDGWSIYAWHGVRVPAKYIDTPDSLGREDLLAEKNAERRRAMMEIVGSDRFSSLFDLEEVSRQRRHPELEEDVLLRTRTTDAVTGEHIQFVRVVCPSTGRVYHLCVPPSILTAAEAVAWTFGHDEQTFAPAVEA